MPVKLGYCTRAGAYGVGPAGAAAAVATQLVKLKMNNFDHSIFIKTFDNLDRDLSKVSCKSDCKT